MPGITGIGLDPIPRRALQPRGRRHHTPDARSEQEPRQPEPRRAGLIGHRHRLRQSLHPFQDLVVIRGQPTLDYLAGLTIQAARHHRSRVHIQPNTRTLIPHWGLPHLVALPARTTLSATHVHM
jgi:hypothetical protein